MLLVHAVLEEVKNSWREQRKNERSKEMIFSQFWNTRREKAYQTFLTDFEKTKENGFVWNVDARGYIRARIGGDKWDYCPITGVIFLRTGVRLEISSVNAVAPLPYGSRVSPFWLVCAVVHAADNRSLDRKVRRVRNDLLRIIREAQAESEPQPKLIALG